MYVDDIMVDVRARSVDRHSGADWTSGEASWPSGGLAKDVAPQSDMDGNHYDHLGNLAVRTDATGASIATWDYDAFGNVLATTGAATAGNYRHTGNHYDPDAGLFYFNNRWYDPALGRFTQRHTPYQPLTEHPYAISEGNPVNLIDFSGLAPAHYFTFPLQFRSDDDFDDPCSEWFGSITMDGETESIQEVEITVEIEEMPDEWAAIIESTLAGEEFATLMGQLDSGARSEVLGKLSLGNYLFTGAPGSQDPTAFMRTPVGGEVTTIFFGNEGAYSYAQGIQHEFGHAIGYEHGPIGVLLGFYAFHKRPGE